MHAIVPLDGDEIIVQEGLYTCFGLYETHEEAEEHIASSLAWAGG